MRRWLEEDVIATGRLPLLCFLLGFILGFLFIRLSVRMIRAKVRWWPGNLRAGDVHIHHMVFGVVLVLGSGLGMVAVLADATTPVAAALSIGFGVGAALVLDEFALIYYLRDVYWEEQGRTSVDAVFVALAVTGLLLLGFHPLSLLEINDFRESLGTWGHVVAVCFAFANLAMAAIVIAKGKIWTGLFGMFFPPLLFVGALRLSRPGAPWARWRYGDRRRLMARAIVRERRYRRPVIRAKIFVQDLVAGKPDVEHVRTAAEAELSRTVVPAPPSPHRHHFPWTADRPGVGPNDEAGPHGEAGDGDGVRDGVRAGDRAGSAPP
ncbi:hypothetical protein [Nocardia higoensis]|uniref:hypothetical protein n=1 Tax=Nocardia higoensis TaxID=228599 RepID=UPI000316BBE7|nr:hypothetical protein [Nocardia higoensis]